LPDSIVGRIGLLTRFALEAKAAPDNAGRTDVSSDPRMLVAVPGDSTRVERSMDCSKLPDSVTGVRLRPGNGEIETLIWWDTLRLAWLVLSPSTFQPKVPLKSTWTEVGLGGGGGGGAGVTMIVPFIQS